MPVNPASVRTVSISRTSFTGLASGDDLQAALPISSDGTT